MPRTGRPRTISRQDRALAALTGAGQSVRDVAATAGMSPATTARALRELAAGGLAVNAARWDRHGWKRT